MNNFDVLLGMKLGGGGGSSTLVEKTITANGTYNPADDNADGYSSVTANVPNTYTVADEGKVVSSGALVSQSSRNIDANGTYDTTLNNSVDVAVPNSYTAGDEGKVVSQGDLVAQSAYPSTIVANGTYDTTLNNSVTVDVPTGGGATEKDVNFYDYDGTLVYSYTAQEFLALTELPANPTHTGLTAQGWNWSLADAKTYVTSYNKLNIGQMYVTDDGKTRLYCTFGDGCLNPYIYVDVTQTADIDWGDGTTTTVNSGTLQNIGHVYANVGDYIISLGIGIALAAVDLTNSNSPIINNGTVPVDVSINKNSAYQNSLKKIEFGVTQRNLTLFRNCSSLTSITMPSSVTSIGTSAFRDCYSLTFVVIPSSVTSIPTNAFMSCYSLSSVSMSSSVTSVGMSAFQNCDTITSITIPSGVTSIGQYAFYFCSTLTFVTIPSGVTSIYGNAFQYCYVLDSVSIPSTVTTIGTNAFQHCYSMGKITINKPEGSISGSPWGAPSDVQIVWTG